MFEIAVPSLIRLVLRPSARAVAIASLPPSVMKTPASPASSACLVHSMRVSGGQSGRAAKATANCAIDLSLPFAYADRVVILSLRRIGAKRFFLLVHESAKVPLTPRQRQGPALSGVERV